MRESFEGIVIFLLDYIFNHLANAFIQSDLELLYMSEVAHLWSD